MNGVRIALIGPLPPPAGGMAKQTAQLADLLTKAGFEVDLVQVNPPWWPFWAKDLRGLRALLRLPGYLFRLWTAARKAQLLHVMANSGWSWHLHAAPAVWIGRLCGKGVVLNYAAAKRRRFSPDGPG
jgi:phenylacetate-CoA ligase